ncbi:hypothetical protein ABIA38_002137 [Embleya sp. AB8]
MCGTKVIPVPWSDGRWEWFLVGSDGRVWHSWQSAPGAGYSTWETLGGSHDVIGGVWNNQGVISVLGSDGRHWCDRWVPSTPGWSDWYAC